MPQLHDQRARHGRAGRRLRRPDRQRRTTTRSPATTRTATSSRHGYDDRRARRDDIFLLRRSNYIGSTPTSGSHERGRGRPGVRRAPARQLRHADQPASTAATLTLCYDSDRRPASRAQRLTAVSGTPFLGHGLRRRPADPPRRRRRGRLGRRLHDRRASTRDGTYIVLAETLPTGVSLTTEQVPTAERQRSTASRIGVLLGDVTTPDPTGDATSATRTTSGSTTTPRSTAG